MASSGTLSNLGQDPMATTPETPAAVSKDKGRAFFSRHSFWPNSCFALSFLNDVQFA